MSRPFVLGSDAALWIRRVQWTIGFRGPRMPVSQIPGGFEVCGPAIFDQVRSTGRSLRELSTCALLLRGLVAYYEQIGSDFDAARWRDVLVVVDCIAAEAARRVGGSLDFGVGEAWDAAFRKAFAVTPRERAAREARS